MNKKIVIIAPGVPHPTKGASTVVFYHYIDGLKKSGFIILNILLLSPDNSNVEDLNYYTKLMEDRGKFEIFPIKSDKFVKKHKLAVDFPDAILNRVKDFDPGAVFCLDFLSAWVSIRFTGYKKFVWLGDLNFQTYWYNTLYSIKEGKVKKTQVPFYFFKKIKTVLIWRYLYQKILKQVNFVIVSSKSSEKKLLNLGINSVYRPYPWPNIDLDRELVKQKKNSIPTFIIYGTLKALGCRSSFHFIFNKLYPELIKKWGKNKFQIFICGRGELADWIKEELAGKKELNFMGFVEDIDGLIRSCHGILVPISTPVGNRSRIITAFAKNALIIAHKNTALANPDLIDGETCFLAETPGEFFERMNRAFQCQDQIAVMIKKANQCYQKSFDPKKAVAFLEKDLLKVIRE